MSTASWSIDRETAEIIMPDGPNSVNLDNAWPRNGGLWSANSYEWCHVFDGGIECVACGLQHIIDQDEEFDRRNEDGKLDFCTYEFTELMHCDCGTTLGGWEEDCSICGENCSTYENSGLHLFGYLGNMDLLGVPMYEFVATADDIPPDDVRESLDPICGPCLDNNYTYDHFKDGIESPIGDGGMAWKIERIEEED